MKKREAEKKKRERCTYIYKFDVVINRVRKSDETINTKSIASHTSPFCLPSTGRPENRMYMFITLGTRSDDDDNNVYKYCTARTHNIYSMSESLINVV